MKRKTMLFVTMCMLALLSVRPLSVHATDTESYGNEQTERNISVQEGVSVRYKDMKIFTAKTSVTGRTIFSEMYVATKNGNTTTSGTMCLQRYSNGSWQSVATWSVTGQGSFGVSKTYTGTPGYKYRTYISIQVGADSISYTTNEVTVN